VPHGQAQNLGGKSKKTIDARVDLRQVDEAA
jgi:hypothetical protein